MRKENRKILSPPLSFLTLLSVLYVLILFYIIVSTPSPDS